MTICVFTRSTTFHNKSGGLETQNKTLCEGLAKKGHKVVVMTTSLSLGSSEKVDSNIEYKFLDCPSGKYSREWWTQSVAAYKDISLKCPFDILISQSSAGKEVFSRFPNGEKVVVNHGTAFGELRSRFNSIRSLKDAARFFVKDIVSFLQWYLEDVRIFSLADSIVCVSEILKEQSMKQYPQFKNKFAVIANGVDINRFKYDKKRKAGQFNLLYVGRVVEEKGIRELLEAVSVVHNSFPNVRLIIVGGGKDLDKFRDLSKMLKINDVVNCVGEVENKNIVEYYESSDIFVYPSLRQEGFPMVFAEAMASSLPIVASNIGGIPSAVKDGVNGLLIKPGLSDDLSRAIVKLYKDSSLCQKLSEGSRNLAETEYSQEVMVGSYVKLFERLLSTR